MANEVEDLWPADLLNGPAAKSDEQWYERVIREHVEERDRAYGFLQKSEAKNRALAESLAKMTVERDAYRKAKRENDDRFMTERDEARAEVATLREKLEDARKQAAPQYTGPLDVEALARLDWGAYQETVGDSDSYEKLGRLYREAVAAGAAAVAKAIASRLLADDVVEAFKDGYYREDEEDTVLRFALVKDGLQAAIAKALGDLGKPAAVDQADPDRLFPGDLDHVDAWERGGFGRNTSASQADALRALAWLVRREMARSEGGAK